MADAFVFPGQGSQSAGMQADLAERYAEVRQTWEEANAVLGLDLWSLVQEGSAEQLGQTTVTQPAMLAAGVAAYRAFRAAGGDEPQVVSGHSLGEYSALVAAGAIEFADAMRVVKRRSELMQTAVPAGVGAMAAVIGLDDDAIRRVCADASDGEVVEAVNFNAPGQVVIAGHAAAVARAIAAAKAVGARRAIPLPVSVPSHSSLMRDAGLELAGLLAETRVEPPKIKAIGATDALLYTDAEGIREHLSRQVYSPVQWVRTSKVIVENGVDRVVECGPGKVLAGLQRRIDRSVPVATLDSLDGLEAALG
ncbi:MAG: ACP S-malonyltransferase [Pseudomonadota bacterium]